MTRPPVSRLRGALALGVAMALTACGSSEPESTTPDESGDMAVGSRGQGGQQGFPGLEGTRPAGPRIDGTQWRWMEGHCTGGSLGLSSKGFAQQLRVQADRRGLLLLYDQAFAKQACAQTVVQRAIPGKTPDAEWQMVEEAHVSLPPGCGLSPEPNRSGNVRLRGELLEVYVQRSTWCNGYDVRMVYAPVKPTPLEPDQLLRHYVAHFNRQDARAIASLFAQDGSLVEPFSESATGRTRHSGRRGVYRWYSEAFANTPWVALRLTSIKQGELDGQHIAQWEYMDPRLDSPLPGQSSITHGGGEIFELRMRLRRGGRGGGEPEQRRPEQAKPSAQGADAGVAAGADAGAGQ